MFKKLTEESKSQPEYRTFVYFQNFDGVMESMIVSAARAEELFEEGWRTSPAAFLGEHKATDVAIVDDFNQVMQTIINIDKIEDLDVLKDLATRFFKMDVNSRASVKSLRKQLLKKAKAEGMV